MKNSVYAMFISTALVSCGQTSFAEAMHNELGDATTIVSPNKVLGSTGNPNEIGDFSAGSLGQDTGAFATRHARAGNASGIGGSYLGTTNVTAESSPARTGSTPVTAVRALIPTSRVNIAPTQLFSESMTQPASTTLPEIGPDISNQWNPTSPSYSLSPASSSSIDFFTSQKRSQASDTFSKTMGVPSFDSF